MNITDRDRISEIQLGYIKWSNRTLKILGAIIAIQIAFGLVGIYLYTRIENRFKTALEIRCVEDNDRHDKTLGKLNDIANKSIPNPQTRKSVVDNNTLLVNTIVPKYEDCKKRVDQLTSAKPPKKGNNSGKEGSPSGTPGER